MTMFPSLFFAKCGFAEGTDSTQTNKLLDSTNYFEMGNVINIKLYTDALIILVCLCSFKNLHSIDNFWVYIILHI